jgi:hypothetical protein
MNTDEYINHLNSELKGFSPQEKAVVIEEITTHIEEGQADSRLGHDAQERTRKLKEEMGSPNDLGRRLKEVHNPNRWIDFLLVFVPTEIVMYILLIILSIALKLPSINVTNAYDPYIVAGIRVSFILSILMVIITRHRRSLGALFFWLPQAIIAPLSLLFREKLWLPQYPIESQKIGIIESLFWIVTLIVLVSWLAYMLWVNRHNLLLIVLALIPFLITIENITGSSTISTGYFPSIFYDPNLTVIHFFGLPLGLYQINILIWPLLFYVFRNRHVRWFGLFLYAVPIGLMNIRVVISNSLLLPVIWTIPFIVVLLSWLIDTIRHTHQPNLVTW